MKFQSPSTRASYENAADRCLKIFPISSKFRPPLFRHFLVDQTETSTLHIFNIPFNPVRNEMDSRVPWSGQTFGRTDKLKPISLRYTGDKIQRLSLTSHRRGRRPQPNENSQCILDLMSRISTQNLYNLLFFAFPDLINNNLNKCLWVWWMKYNIIATTFVRSLLKNRVSLISVTVN